MRDCLLGHDPQDWDICTSALPSETLRLFSAEKSRDYGLKHGTVTVIIDKHSYEITTFRKENSYTDFRRPDQVQFVDNIHDDLLRRDISINAMAYHPLEGLIDDHQGVQDLKKKLIRCVGFPEKRFHEDALRILRVLRFASTLNFSIETQTEVAARANCSLLSYISQERLCSEFQKLLLGVNAGFICHTFQDIFYAFIAMNALQRQSWRMFSPHLSSSPSDLIVRLLLLLGGSPEKDMPVDVAALKTSLQSLRFNNHLIQDTLQLAAFQNFNLTSENVKLLLSELGEAQLLRLIDLQESRLFLKSSATQNCEKQKLAALRKKLDVFLHHTSNPCYQLKHLTISGQDLLAAGIPPGPEIGQILQELLKLVLSEKIPNEPHHLLTAALKLHCFSLNKSDI